MSTETPKTQVVVTVTATIRKSTSDTPLVVVFTADATALYRQLTPGWRYAISKLLSQGPR